MTTITLGGETLTISDELLQKIKDEQKPTIPTTKWVPKYGETVYEVISIGEVREKTYQGFLNSRAYHHNNAYPTREEAEKAVLRMQSAERRYLPEDGEEYKTLDSDGDVTNVRWNGDTYDIISYHSGMVWHEDTPDLEILVWYDKYWDAWKVTK